MRLRRKKGSRIQSMPSHLLLDAGFAALNAAGGHLQGFHDTGSVDELAGFEIASNQLGEIVTEMLLRNTHRNLVH